MQKKQWLQTAVTLALLRALTLSAYAQDGYTNAAVTGGSGSAMVQGRHGSGSGSFGFEGRMGKAVGLTPEQRESVHGLLADQRQQKSAIQDQTDTKIRALLNADQQKKFDAFLSQQKQARGAKPRKAS